MPMKLEARRFLRGLSCDELQFIAEFLGACVLEARHDCARGRGELAREIASFQAATGAGEASPDREHKMILLLEFLCRSGVSAARMAAREHAVN